MRSITSASGISAGRSSTRRPVAGSGTHSASKAKIWCWGGLSIRLLLQTTFTSLAGHKLMGTPQKDGKSSHKVHKGHKEDLTSFPFVFFVFFVPFVAKFFSSHVLWLPVDGPLAAAADGAGQAHRQPKQEKGPVGAG